MVPAFSSTIAIDAPAAELFALTQNYDLRLDWDPFLKRADLVGGASEPGVGVRALCVAKSGLGMETEYVSFDPPKGCAIRMTAGPRIIAEFAGSWRFRERAPGMTEVAFRYRIVGRPHILTPILKLIFAWDTRKRLRGLKRFVEQTVVRETMHSNPAS